MYGTDVEKAREYALGIHKGDVDKAGEPYAGHLERVAAGVEAPEAKVVAWLHDTVEDHPDQVTFEKIAGLFGQETADALRCVTHRKDESYEDYVARAKTNPVARAVKLSDLKDNSNLSRLKVVTPEDVDRLEKYVGAFRILLS